MPNMNKSTPSPQTTGVLLPVRGSGFRMSVDRDGAVNSVQTELKAIELLMIADGGSMTESTLPACLFCLGKTKQNTLMRTCSSFAADAVNTTAVSQRLPVASFTLEAERCFICPYRILMELCFLLSIPNFFFLACSATLTSGRRLLEVSKPNLTLIPLALPNTNSLYF